MTTPPGTPSAARRPSGSPRLLSCPQARARGEGKKPVYDAGVGPETTSRDDPYTTVEHR